MRALVWLTIVNTLWMTFGIPIYLLSATAGRYAGRAPDWLYLASVFVGLFGPAVLVAMATVLRSLPSAERQGKARSGPLNPYASTGKTFDHGPGPDAPRTRSDEDERRIASGRG